MTCFLFFFFGLCCLLNYTADMSSHDTWFAWVRAPKSPIYHGVVFLNEICLKSHLWNKHFCRKRPRRTISHQRFECHKCNALNAPVTFCPRQQPWHNCDVMFAAPKQRSSVNERHSQTADVMAERSKIAPDQSMTVSEIQVDRNALWLQLWPTVTNQPIEMQHEVTRRSVWCSGYMFSI